MQPPVQTIIPGSQQHIAVDCQTKTAVPQVLGTRCLFQPASLDLEHGLPLGLHDALLDLVNGFLRQPDAAGELVLPMPNTARAARTLAANAARLDAQLLLKIEARLAMHYLDRQIHA